MLRHFSLAITSVLFVAATAVACGSSQPTTTPAEPSASGSQSTNVAAMSSDALKKLSGPGATDKPAEVDPCVDDTDINRLALALGGEDPQAAIAAAVKLDDQRDVHYQVQDCPSIHRALRAALASKESLVVRAAVELAKKFPGYGVDVLPLLKHQDDRIRAAAVFFFGAQPYGPAVPLIILLLNDPGAGYGVHGALDAAELEVLAQHEDALGKAYERWLASANDELVSLFFKQMVSKPYPGIGQAVAPFLAHEQYWRSAVYMLAQIGDARQADPLLDLLDSKQLRDEKDRLLVILALNRCDPDWGLSDKAPRWMRKLAGPLSEYRKIRLAHANNKHLDGMISTCAANAVKSELDKLLADDRDAGQTTDLGPSSAGGIGEVGGSAAGVGVTVSGPMLGMLKQEQQSAHGGASQGAGPGAGAGLDSGGPVHSGTEEEARDALEELKPLARKLREQIKRASRKPQQRKILAFYVPEFVVEEVAQLSRCK